MPNTKKRIIPRLTALTGLTALSLAIALALSLSLAAIAPPIAAAATPPEFSESIGPRANTREDPAGGVYVSPDGNDSTADGSIGKPYKSINTALQASPAGSTIILRSGTYREGQNVRIRKPDVTIRSAKGEWAVIDLTEYGSHDEDSGVYFDVDASGGKLQCVEVIGGFYAVCTETKWGWHGDDDWVAARGVLIEDCVLHDSRYDVVKVKPNCNNTTIRYNEIYNSGRAFDGKPRNGEDNAEGVDNVNGSGMKVQNNYIHDIVSNAIYAKGGAMDVLIENNFIETAYGAGIMLGFDTSPEFFSTDVNPEYYENIRGVVRNNLIIGAGWEGIGLYGSKDAQVYNNTLIDVANGGRYHSAIYFGLTFQDWKSHPGRPGNINPNIHHNIVSQPASFKLPMIEIRYSEELGVMPALIGDPAMGGNCYYIEGKKAAFNDRRPGSELDGAGLSAWQAHICGDAGSIEEDPALGQDYMPSNPKCDGMGIAKGLAAPPSMSDFRRTLDYSPKQFADVDEGAWYGYSNQKAIAHAYEFGLMEGVGGGAFDPAGNMTLAQAIAIAVRVHSIYKNGKVFSSQSTPWYSAYIDYAAEAGMITPGDFSAGATAPDYGRPATRAEMAFIFSRSLPIGEFPAINKVNSLPDVNAGTPHSEAIITLFEAGVLTGGDSGGTFNPSSNVTRAEAAAIISRVVLPGARASGRVY
ncbi:MAG: S-layer homology domain-containing protein [Oscillospiraceae bacterium]|nr:S-layer homology domain-containing protein [Oscillospiraceae bacterium]